MEHFTKEIAMLSEEDRARLEQQNSRLVSDFKANKLEIDAKKNWDLFYKRNETRFFKDRHWTTREFEELLDYNTGTDQRVILEIGCGVGNLIFPLLEEKLNFFALVCDLSHKAIELVKNNSLYDESKIKAFQADITSESILSEVSERSVDVATLVFVLSAIHPDNFKAVLSNVFTMLKPGGILLFRDYGLHDIAQIRFKPGHKIAENFYMRQDGTRSYYFSTDFAEKLFTECGFEIILNSYVHRRTVNKKENIDVPRIFIQAKLKKPQ